MGRVVGCVAGAVDGGAANIGFSENAMNIARKMIRFMPGS